MLTQFENVYTFWFENGASNICYFEYEDGLACFDSSLFPEKFEKTLKLMQEKTGKKLKKVFLTHYHPDHSFGAIFSDYKFDLIMNKLTLEKLYSIEKIFLRDLSKTTNFNFSNLHEVLSYKHIELFDSNSFTIFDKTIVSGSLTGGHSEDSSVYILKPLNYLISGDLIFSRVHSEYIDSNISHWNLWLINLKKLNFKKIIPGHGKPGENLLISEQLKYNLDFCAKKDLKKEFPNYSLSEIIPDNN
jgi:glyoxylase-like metal-dependent hydrolase (beta-lactamase superfamily II)